MKKDCCSWLKIFVCLHLLFLALAVPADGQEKSEKKGPPNNVQMAPSGSLVDTVRSVISYHPTVKSFQEYRQAADFDVARARSGWWPRIDAHYELGRVQWADDTTRPAKKWYRYADRNQFYLVISQTIWDGLATYRRWQIGKHSLESAENRLYDNAESLALDGTLAHIEVLRQRKIVEFSTINVDNHKQILAAEMERQKGGVSTMADVSQAQSRLSTAEATLTESRQALASALVDYKRLTGRDAGELEEVALPVTAYPSVDVALDRALVANPKITTYIADVKTAVATKDLAMANFSPTAKVEAGPTWEWQRWKYKRPAHGFSVLLKFDWNIFDGFYDYYNVKGNQARIRQARQQVFVTMDDIFQETGTTWEEYAASRSKALTFADAVNYSIQTRDLYTEQFNLGDRSLLDLLTSQNEVYANSVQLETNKKNEIATMYRLLALGGELLQTMGIDRTSLNIDTDENPTTLTSSDEVMEEYAKRSPRIGGLPGSSTVEPVATPPPGTSTSPSGTQQSNGVRALPFGRPAVE